MLIVVENGSYRMDNLGDVAMLQVCVGRIRRRWPYARTLVVTEAPDRLRASVPGAEPLSPGQGHRIPMTVRTRAAPVLRLERWLQLHAPRLAYRAKRRQIAHDAGSAERYDRYQAALRDADAVVCSGGGFLNDHHAEHGEKVLHGLGTAQGDGTPTAMFGAGLGPLSESRARAVAAPVIRRLRVLGLRERSGNLRELATWGVGGAAAVRVTGDDAIALALGEDPFGDGHGGRDPRSPDPESLDAIGVSVRAAAEYGLPDARGLGGVLREFASSRRTGCVGLPVRARWSPDNDIDALKTALGSDAPDLATAASVDSPGALIERIGRCRVVLTGTYHAGVFALSLGIPIVTLSGSEYYDRKFAGLAEQFGAAGVRTLRYGDPELGRRAAAALDALWAQQPALAPALREAAQRQVRQGRAAYEAFFHAVEQTAARGRFA